MDGSLECVFSPLLFTLPFMCPTLDCLSATVTSANTNPLLQAWLSYNAMFRTKAASDPSLQWDI